MAWDASRPVPWKRLTKEWVIYASIMAVIFGLVLQSATALGSALGLLISLPVYLAVGAILAKFGYQRPTIRRGAPRASNSPRSPAEPTGRSRPSPTRRTSTGPSQRPKPKPRQRRR